MGSHRFAYMPFFVDDFQDSLKVRAMTTSEMGAYIALLSAAWDEGNDCLLPDKDRQLRAICHATKEEWPSIREVLIDGEDAVFQKDGQGNILNEKQREVWFNLCKQAEVNKKNASKRRKRSNAPNSLPNGHPSASESLTTGSRSKNDSQPTGEPMSDPISHSSNPKLSNTDTPKQQAHSLPAEDPDPAGEDQAYEESHVTHEIEQITGKPVSSYGLQRLYPVVRDTDKQSIQVALDMLRDRWPRGKIREPYSWLAETIKGVVADGGSDARSGHGRSRRKGRRPGQRPSETDWSAEAERGFGV